ncbi:hypothetical protein ACGFIR_11340 [Micromonospora sp. NPDC049051]|uniref:hypothetical protein n=1 Tax=Micromonospora sp. NPDC049051 TaxID=3364264 RepID=UPI003717D045
MDDESEPGRGWVRALFRWLGAAAAIAGIVGLVFQMIEWADSRNPPPPVPTTSVDAGAPTSTVKANGDEQFVQAEQCVRIVRQAETLVLKAAPCGNGTQRVLARIERPVTDEGQAIELCKAEAPDYVDFHYSNWEKRSDFVDVVFCLAPA